jgi:enoyl-CoA hydratase/carnithine racemase
MKPIVHTDEELLISNEKSLRRITLNRPRAMNALTFDMVVEIYDLLRSWASDPDVKVVLLDGAGERGLCAGGDIRALYNAARSGTDLPQRFWAAEYRLDVLIARYPKPIVAIMDGVVMGGGVGISAYASHRVVTERSAIAMPEVAIGLFPDVGVSFLLSRAPGYVGTHLALTGAGISAGDAIFCGLADFNVPTRKLRALRESLCVCSASQEVDDVLDALSTATSTSDLASARTWIDHCYEPNTIEEIIGRLDQCQENAARRAREVIQVKSPTSLKVTLRNLRDARSFQKLEDCFRQDYRIALACIEGHDFIEGIRAAVIDKDMSPRWRPAEIELVTTELVNLHFRSRGALDLSFEH